MGTFNSAIMGFGSILPPKFIGFILLGFSLSSVIVSIVRLVCLLAFQTQNDETYYYSTLLYFGLNIIILLAITISIPVNIIHQVTQYRFF